MGMEKGACKLRIFPVLSNRLVIQQADHLSSIKTVLNNRGVFELV